MAQDLELSCRCGEVKAVARRLSPGRGTRAVCYCRSCRAFAHFLECAEASLDGHGGVDLFLTSPAAIEFTHGVNNLACVRLTEKGPVRWYANCCKTPIGSTALQSNMPFFGMLPRLLLGSDDQARVDALLGPPRTAFFADHAIARNKRDLVNRGRMSALAIAALGRRLVVAKLRGDHKRSPFVDPATGALRAEPVLLTEAARAALYAKV